MYITRFFLDNSFIADNKLEKNSFFNRRCYSLFFADRFNDFLISSMVKAAELEL